MHTGKAIPIVELNTSMIEALITITEKSFGCVGITSRSQDLVGVITDGDLRRKSKNGFIEKKVKSA